MQHYYKKTTPLLIIFLISAYLLSINHASAAYLPDSIYQKNQTRIENEINKINNNAAKIITKLDTIKRNTAPPGFLDDFLKKVYQDKLYDILFGNKDEPGTFSLLLSIIGLLTSTIKLYTAIAPYLKPNKNNEFQDKSIGKNSTHTLFNALSAVVFFALSLVVFAVSYHSIKNESTYDEAQLKEDLAAIQKSNIIIEESINKSTLNQQYIPRKPSTDTSQSNTAKEYKNLLIQLKNIQLKTSQLDSSINTTSQTLESRIHSGSTSTIWQTLVLILLFITTLGVIGLVLEKISSNQ